MRILYRVQEGDTLDSISKNYNVDKKDILSYNKISVNNVVSGVRLILLDEEGIRYVVKPFDTLSKIAEKYNTSEEKIKKDNNISNIFLGEIIYIKV